MPLEDFKRRVFPDDHATDLERRFVESIFATGVAVKVRSVRADVLRSVLISAPEMIAGQIGRLVISGANVLGELKLRGLRFDYALEFEDTRFGDIQIADLRVVSLDIAGGSARKVEAGRMEVSHDLVVGKGFECGGLRLMSASIGGDLNLGGAQLLASGSSSSLNFDGARVGGRVYLNSSGGLRFRADGNVSGQNARVQGGILCTSGIFRSSVNFTRCQVRGEVSLRGAQVLGELQMSAMDISSDLTLEGTSIPSGNAKFVRTRVGGSFVWKPARDFTKHAVTPSTTSPRQRPVNEHRSMDHPAPSGTVDLTQARFGFLDDDLASWDRFSLRMEGLSFDGLAIESGKVHLKRRIKWLEQPANWSPHPYDQVRAAFRNSGHEAAARKIAIARERTRIKRGRLGPIATASHALYGALLGYGYKPLRFFVVSALVIAAFWLPFSTLEACPRGNKGICHDFTARKTEASDYSAKMYSVDAFLPVDLKQTGDWTPLRHEYGYLTASETVLGWLMAGLLVGAVTGLFRRD